MDSLTIVHLLEPGGGGSMRHVLDLAGAQARAGHRVHIIYSPLRLEALFEPQLRALPSVTLHVLPMRRAPHLSDFQNVAELVKILRTARGDILHAHSTKAGMLARMAFWFTKIPVVYTTHGIMTSDPNTSVPVRFAYGVYEKLLSPFMRAIIVLSEQERAHAITLGIPADKIRMGLNGIAPLPLADRDAIRKSWNLLPEHIAVGFVGRLAYPKNPQLAISAFARAAQSAPQLRLVLIGDGVDRALCEELAQSLNISTQIIWLGEVDAKPLYPALDMLIIPSISEGMAYTFIEALHAGLPVIATPVGGSDRCVIDGQTGFIVPHDAEKMAEKILQLSEDAVLRDAMHFAARAHGRNFTLEKMLAAHDAIYQEALTPP